MMKLIVTIHNFVNTPKNELFLFPGNIVLNLTGIFYLMWTNFFLSNIMYCAKPVLIVNVLTTYFSELYSNIDAKYNYDSL